MFFAFPSRNRPPPSRNQACCPEVMTAAIAKRCDRNVTLTPPKDSIMRFSSRRPAHLSFHLLNLIQALLEARIASPKDVTR